jgi:mannosyltransferase OCH1-like enzyme
VCASFSFFPFPSSIKINRRLIFDLIYLLLIRNIIYRPLVRSLLLIIYSFFSYVPFSASHTSHSSLYKYNKKRRMQFEVKSESEKRRKKKNTRVKEILLFILSVTINVSVRFGSTYNTNNIPRKATQNLPKFIHFAWINCTVLLSTWETDNS